MNIWLLLIPIFSAVIGWAGIWVGNKYLVYTLIPSRKAALAADIGRSVNAAFPFSEIEGKITDPANIKKIMPVVETHVDDFLRNKLKEKMPVISMFIGNKTIDSLKEVFLKEIEDLFPHVMKKFTENLQAELDIEMMVTKAITGVSSSQLETRLAPVLKYYKLCGTILGFIIGALNVLLFILVNQ